MKVRESVSVLKSHTNLDVYTGRRPLSVAGPTCIRGDGAKGPRSPNLSNWTSKILVGSFVFGICDLVTHP